MVGVCFIHRKSDGFTNLDLYLDWMAKSHYFIDYGEELKISLGDMFRGYTSDPEYSYAANVNCTLSISKDTAFVSASGCGFASFILTVIDDDGDDMTKEIL